MTSFNLIEQSLRVVQDGAWLCSGALIGALYFQTLYWNVRMLAFGRPPLLAMALQLGRFALLASALAIIARHFGALPLLLVATGILGARLVAVRLGERT